MRKLTLVKSGVCIKEDKHNKHKAHPQPNKTSTAVRMLPHKEPTLNALRITHNQAGAGFMTGALPFKAQLMHR